METLKQQIAQLSLSEQAKLCQWLIDELSQHTVETTQLKEASLRLERLQRGETETMSQEAFWANLDAHISALSR